MPMYIIGSCFQKFISAFGHKVANQVFFTSVLGSHCFCHIGRIYSSGTGINRRKRTFRRK